MKMMLLACTYYCSITNINIIVLVRVRMHQFATLQHRSIEFDVITSMVHRGGNFVMMGSKMNPRVGGNFSKIVGSFGTHARHKQ